jgi:ABC-2 type transport system permease protein
MATLALRHSRVMTGRHLRELWRQPWQIIIVLTQPIIWLLVFGSLFERIVDIPGFGVADYRAFLTPGVAIMTAIFYCGWTGMGLIEDLNRGVMDRLLTTPVRRTALISGRLAHVTIITMVQTLVIVGLGALIGFRGDLAGVAVLVVSAGLLGWAVGALSTGFALIAREEQAIIGVNMLVLPLTLMSSAFMNPDLMPGWIQAIAVVNPVNWAVEASREALSSGTEWLSVFYRLGGLTILAVLGTWFAVRAFRTYQRSM